MERRKIFTIGFADIAIKFLLPTEANLPKELSCFLVEDGIKAEAEYSVELLETPLKLSGDAVASGWEMEIYKENSSWIRVYKPLVEKDGCQVACLTNEDGRNKIFYPSYRWEFYSSELHLLHLIGIEEILLKNNAFLLHSSMIQIQGQVVLFSGPSGIGKSTQASLWMKYLGAEILNGDRCIIRKKQDGFYGCGSPWCGTSGIYRKEQAPIKGIFILKQSKENKIRRMKVEAFSALLQQSIVNSWNSSFMEKITDLIVELLKDIPVYELECRPDSEAVNLAYSTLFEGEV